MGKEKPAVLKGKEKKGGKEGRKLSTSKGKEKKGCRRPNRPPLG